MHYRPLMVVPRGDRRMLTPLHPETPEARSIRLDRERIRKAFASIDFDHPGVRA